MPDRVDFILTESTFLIDSMAIFEVVLGVPTVPFLGKQMLYHAVWSHLTKQ